MYVALGIAGVVAAAVVIGLVAYAQQSVVQTADAPPDLLLSPPSPVPATVRPSIPTTLPTPPTLPASTTTATFLAPSQPLIVPTVNFDIQNSIVRANYEMDLSTTPRLVWSVVSSEPNISVSIEGPSFAQSSLSGSQIICPERVVDNRCTAPAGSYVYKYVVQNSTGVATSVGQNVLTISP